MSSKLPLTWVKDVKKEESGDTLEYLTAFSETPVNIEPKYTTGLPKSGNPDEVGIYFEGGIIPHIRKFEILTT